MKKIVLLSSLALVLTACSNDITSQGSKPVNGSSELKTTAKSSDNTSTKSEANSDSKPVVTESNTDVFKEFLTNPSRHFDEEVSNIKYAIKNTDTQYLILAGESVPNKGITYVNVFAYDKAKGRVVDTEANLMTGVAGAGGFRGNLEEYTDNPNKLRYTVVSSGSGEYQIDDITFANNDTNDQTIVEGSLRNGEMPKATTREISWTNITGSSQKVNEATTTKSTTRKTETTTSATTTRAATSKVVSNSKIDINAIVNGNLSSIFGRYPSVSQTIVINENDTITLDKGASGELELGILGIQKQGNTAVISTQIKADDAPPGAVVDGIIVKYIVVPAGEKSPVAVPGENVNKDRIIMQGHGIDVLYVN